MSDWFSSLANQAIQYADSFADSLVNQAAEAQRQIDLEQRRIREENEKRSVSRDGCAALPWETNEEALAILSQDLMEKIFYLPMNEKNFTSTAPNSTEVHFTFQEFIPVAMKLLQLDSNLARVHAKVSPKMDEETFWFNYYCRISFLRAASGIEGASAKQNSLRWKEADVIFSSLPQLTTLSESTAPSQVVHDAENEASSISKKLNLGNNKSSVRSAPSGSALSGSSHQGDNSTCSGADEDATSSSSYLKVSPTIGRDELMGDDDLDLLDELDLGDDEECQENMSEADAELEARIALELAQDD